MTRTALALAVTALASGLLPAPAAAQAPLRKIGEMELQLAGLGASLDPVNPVVPKNTPAGVQVIVRAGGRQLTASEVEGLVGGVFFIEAELNGPGLPRTITIPDLENGEPLPADPLILPLPGLSTGGDYELTNIRIVSGGRAVMGVLPEVATLKVIDQVLVTKLVTRPLTLDELKEKGIEITSKDYTGFQFSLALRLESEVVNLDFPVVFDRKGVVVPQPIDTTVTDPTRKVESPAVPRPPAMIVPLMLLPEGEADAGPEVPLTLPNGEPIRIPSVLVIPGNVGYLKQFFSAVVYVANGTPLGSRLFVRDIAGKIQLPPGDDLDPGNDDDPLYLAKRLGEDVPPAERPVLGIGPDETPGTEDDVAVFAPGEQGQAEWVLVGNGEGFHKIDIALGATLDGLPTGPVKVKGAASGGVLVRNPFFDVTFTVPSVVRDGETFKAAITLNNIGQGDGHDVRIRIIDAQVSGLQLLSDAEQSVLQIAAGEAHSFEYEFKSLKTGKVVATYLRFDPEPGVNVQGRVDFTIGVTDEGVPLSPDTLVLPASVNLLPGAVTYQAMRVLGQAWSIANAPRGSLPARVTRITRGTVEQKALALAEAGLRVTLRDADDRDAALGEALRDLALDFWGGDPVDPGFDRLLREGGAGRALTEALGAALAPAADVAGGAAAFEGALAEVAASGPDFLSLSVVGDVDVALTDSLGRRSVLERQAGGDRSSAIPGAVLLPLGPPEAAPIVGLLTVPAATGYRLDVSGPAAITLTAPQGGSFVRGSVNADGRAVLAIDLARPEAWVLEQDTDGDGVFELQRPVAMETLEPNGPELLAASIIGSETLPRAGDFGLNAVLVFDRPVDQGPAGDTSAYSIPSNSVAFAKPQLSGRLVFATLDQPEGPNVETDVSVSGLADRRGFSRDATTPLRSRLTRGGAYVSGQVREASGTPVDEGSVVYSNIHDAGCAVGGQPQPLARVPLGPDGSYEIRYVRQGPCGFEVAAADTRNVLLRRLEARVRRPGERMLLDIVLLGEGAVEGFVRDLAGQPVAGAAVAVQSETDHKRGGGAVSDATGHYRVDGLPVGLVSVKAGFGAGLGSATGRIERAGTAALVNVTLDSGAVTVSGDFRQVKDGAELPVAGALMTFLTASGPAGYVFSNETGAFRFEGMPVGNFTIQGRGNGPFGEASAALNGFAAAGQTVQDFALVHVAKPEAVLGTLRGRVLLPTGAGAAGVIVAQDVSTGFIQNATGTDAEGHFELSGLPTGVNISIGAITTDRRRQGYAWAFIDPVTQEQDGVVITLSAIGSATFTVLGPNNAAIGNQEVALLGVGGFAGVCRNPCGCRSGVTDLDGKVTFTDLPLGAYTAQAVRREGGFTEAATGTAVITSETVPGFGTVQLLGSGTVTGSVSLASAQATFTGGSVSLVSRAFVNDGQFSCGMVTQESHRAQVNPATSVYEFKGVAVGAVSATGRSDLGVATKKGNLASAGSTLTLDLEFVDTIAGELSGRVFLPSGTPAGQGVEVTVNGPLPDVTVYTDADSHFAFAPVLPQGNYSITARDPVTGGVVRESIYLRAGQDLQHDLRLLGRGTVRVKVEDALGAAVDRASVTLLEQQYPKRRHDRSIEPTLLGVATFEEVFEGPFSVEVKDLVGRGGRGSGAVPAPDASVDVTVKLNPTGSVRGDFVMPDGETLIPYALVTLVVNGRAVGQTTTPGTGDQIGEFSFDFVPAGPIRVEAEDPLTLRTGFAVATLEPSAPGEPPLDLRVIAKGLGLVRGKVLARVPGGPDEIRPGATVKIQAGSYKGSTLADAEGTYEFGGVPEGALTVTASIGAQALSGSASGAITEDAQVLPLDVYLRDAGSVTGRVLRSDEETPAPPSKVTIHAGGTGGGSQVTYTSDGGLFSFAQVATGRATLSVEELGGADRGRGAVEVEIGENQAEVVMNGVGTLLLKARDSNAEAIAGDVWLNSSGAFPWQAFVRVPASGEFRLTKLLAGAVTAKLRAQPGAVALWGTATGEVAADQEQELILTLAESGTVTGRILRAGGLLPAYGADVKLELSGVGQVSVQADESGAFVATGIPLVEFDLRASDPVSGGIAVVRARRIAANGDTLDLGEIVLDDTAPLAAIVEPADGSVQAGTGGPLVIELADDGSGLELDSLVVYYSSGQAQYASEFQFSQGRAVGVLRPSAVAVGSNTLRAYVKDQSGRIGEAQVTFRVLGATIRGAVLPAAGSSAAGAAVSAGSRSTVADETGAFAITGLRGGSYFVSASDPQIGLVVQKFVTVADGGETSVELQLPSFARVSGTVTRRSGPQGVAGVVVAVAGAYPRQDETDANGFYELAPLPLGSHTLEATETASGDRGRAVVTLAQSGAVTLPIELNGVGSLEVIVARTGGARVAGAAVSVDSSSPFATDLNGSTGAAGEAARFPKVFAGLLTVTASYDGLSALTTLTLPDQQARSVEVTLPPSARIEGVVSEATTGVAVGATVRLTGVKTATNVTGAGGAYAFDNVPLGDFEIDAETSRGDRGRSSGRISAPDSPVTVPIRLNGLGHVKVTVTDAGDELVSGVDVTLRSSGPFGGFWSGKTVGGVFEDPDVLAGGISVTVRNPANGAVVETGGTLDPGGRLELSVTLDPTATIAGVVRAAGGGSVVQGAAVTIVGRSGQSVTDASGSFSFANVPLGVYQLEVRVAGRLRARVAGIELDQNGETESREIELILTGEVTGKVTKAGASVSGASVSLTSQATPWGGAFPAVFTDANGDYSIDDVPPGVFTLVAAKGSDRRDASGEMPATGGVQTVDLVLLSSAILVPTGRLDANGFTWTIGRAATLDRNPNFPTSSGTPRLLIERGLDSAAFAGSCPATGACFVPTEEGQREFVFEEAGLLGLQVTRKIFVPVDGYFVRIVDSVTNPPGAPEVTVNLVEQSDLASSLVRASSSEDLAATAADQWIVLDDGDQRDIWSGGGGFGGFAPTAFAAWGPGGTAPTDLSVAPVSGRARVTQRWDGIVLGPGETRAILHFVSVQSDKPRAEATGERLVQLPPEALAGLSPEEAAAVLNFVVPRDLVSSVPPLPANDGVAEALAISGDRATAFRPAGTVQYRSLSPYYGLPRSMGYFTFGLVLSVSGVPSSGIVVPRAPFEVTATHSTVFGSRQLRPGGDFAPESGTARVDVVFEGTGTLKGLVQRIDGSPINGGNVVLARGSQSLPPLLLSDNAFEFAAVPAGTYVVTSNNMAVGIPVSAAGIVLPGPCTTPPEGLTCAAVTRNIVYPALGAVEGVVTTAAGFGIGARLELIASGFSRSLRSQASSGAYRFDDVPPGAYTLRATDDTRSQGQVAIPIVVTTGPDPARALTLLPVGTVRVTAISGEAPFANGWVYWQSDARGPALVFGGVTDGGGIATLTNVVGDPVRIRVQQPSNSKVYGEGEGRMTAEADLVPVAVTVPEVGTITGVLRSRGGEALAATALAMNAARDDFFASWGTGSSGAFTLSGVPRGPLFLRGQLSGSGAWSRWDEPVVLSSDSLQADAHVPVGQLGARDSHVWEIEVPAGTTLSAGVQSWAHAGHPALPTYALELFTPEGELTATANGSSGSFVSRSVSDAMPGAWLVTARSTSDTPGGYRVGSMTDDAVHVFRPFVGGVVEIAVRRGPLPVTSLAVETENARTDLPEEERTRDGATDALGGYRVPMRSGPITARVVDPATGDSHAASGELLADGTLRLAIDLPERPTTLTGFVTNGDGSTGLAGAYVELLRAGSWFADTYTDAAGAYRFDGVPPETYTLRAWFDAYTAEAPLTLVGGTVTRDIVMPIAVVRGQVLEPPPDAGGVPGALVELCFSGFCRSTTAGANGAFLFYEGARDAASATLRATVGDGSGLSVSATIPWGSGFVGTATRNLVLPQTASLRVTVSAPGGGGAAEAATVEVYRDDPYSGPQRLRQAATDANGQVTFRHFSRAERVRVYGEQDESVGQAFADLEVGEERAAAIALSESGWLDVGIDEDSGGVTDGSVTVQSIEQPARQGGVWTRHLQLYEPEGGNLFSETIRVPVGAYRVVFPQGEEAGVEEGVLAAGETASVRVRPGTHVRVPRPLRGDESLFVGEYACPPPCSGFARTRLPGAEEYPPFAAPESDGRSLRSLRVAGSGVRVRRLQYAPRTGAFGRTLTLVTNPESAPAPVSVPLDTVLELVREPGTVVTPGGGPVDLSQPWVVMAHDDGLQGLVVGGALAPERFELVAGPEVEPRLEARHALALDPGETGALLSYTLVGMGGDTGPLQARAEALATLAEPGAVFGLTNEERAAIVNFAAVPPAGDLLVAVTSNLEVVVGATVGVLDGSGDLVAPATTTGPDGTAFFAGLPPGVYTIVATGESGRPGRVVAEVTAGTAAADTVTAEIALLADDALGSVDVTATWNGSGAAASGVRLALEAEGWSPVWRPLAETDEDGLVSFGLVPPGTVVVAPVAGVGGDVSVEVTAAAAVPAALALEPFATLSGQLVAGDGGTPVANAAVAALDIDSGAVLASGRTDESGSYRLDGVRPGPSGVRVRAASPYDAAVVVESSNVIPDVPGGYGVELLVLPVGVISGEVGGSEGNVRHPVAIAADSSGRSIVAQWTDDQGNFQIVGVAAGQVTVTVVDPATGDRESQTLDVEPGSPQWLWFFLGPVPE